MQWETKFSGVAFYNPDFIHPLHFGVWAVHFSLCSSTICLVGGPKEQNLMYYFYHPLLMQGQSSYLFLNKKNKMMEAKSAIKLTYHTLLVSPKQSSSYLHCIWHAEQSACNDWDSSSNSFIMQEQQLLQFRMVVQCLQFRQKKNCLQFPAFVMTLDTSYNGIHDKLPTGIHDKLPTHDFRLSNYECCPTKKQISEDTHLHDRVIKKECYPNMGIITIAHPL
jgi:hypothetical protein